MLLGTGFVNTYHTYGKCLTLLSELCLIAASAWKMALQTSITCRNFYFLFKNLLFEFHLWENFFSTANIRGLVFKTTVYESLRFVMGTIKTILTHVSLILPILSLFLFLALHLPSQTSPPYVSHETNKTVLKRVVVSVSNKIDMMLLWPFPTGITKRIRIGRQQ